MDKKIITNKEGLTLIEMVVAIGVFVVVIFMSSNIFLAVMSGQRRSIAQQNTQENMRYVYETLSREIRQAQRSDTQCFSGSDDTTNRNYNTNEEKNALYFKNKDGDCVLYALVDDVLVVRRGTRVASTTPEFLKISGLVFEIIDNKINQGVNPRVQPRVTFKMKAEMKNQAIDNSYVYMQTTISSRYYE